MVVTFAMWLAEKVIDEQAAGGDVVFVDKGGGGNETTVRKGYSSDSTGRA